MSDTIVRQQGRASQRRPRPAQLHKHEFDAGNYSAALIVSQDSERYGGDHAGLVRWARAFLRRRDLDRTGQASLFREVA